MHEGEVDTHHVPGEEIWVLDANSGNRVHRIELEVPATSIMVTQEAQPKLIVADDNGGTHVYDALTFAFERTIVTPGAAMFEDF